MSEPNEQPITETVTGAREPFTRILNPGSAEGEVYVKVAWDGRRLSITGVEGPLQNGDCRGSCGQISGTLRQLELFHPRWEAPRVNRLADLWDRWHLNDMRAGCEHQREEWDTATPLELQDLGWTVAFHELQRKAGAGKMPPEEYADFASKARAVYMLTVESKRPKHPVLWRDIGAQLLANGYVQLGKTETKPAGQVYPEEHPNGMLTKPCPKCGHKYGSAWLCEEVPTSVLEELRAMPAADTTPAWI